MNSLHTYRAAMMVLMNLWNQSHRIQRHAQVLIFVWTGMGTSFWCPSLHPCWDLTAERTSLCVALFSGFILALLAALQRLQIYSNAVSSSTPSRWHLSSPPETLNLISSAGSAVFRPQCLFAHWDMKKILFAAFDKTSPLQIIDLVIFMTVFLSYWREGTLVIACDKVEPILCI